MAPEFLIKETKEKDRICHHTHRLCHLQFSLQILKAGNAKLLRALAHNTQELAPHFISVDRLYINTISKRRRLLLANYIQNELSIRQLLTCLTVYLSKEKVADTLLIEVR